jgi:CBS domain containing-hemolysin-like protein
MLAASQLGITLCSLGLGAVAEPAVSHVLEGVLGLVHAPEGLLHPVSFAVALALVVFLHMVLGEMVPKNIAIAAPERAAVVLVPPLAAFAHKARPVLDGLNALANLALRAVRVEPKDELATSFSPDELAAILEESREEGLLDEEEHERLSGALELGSQPASTVMLPLDRLVTVPDTVTADELEELVVVTGFSRFPMRSSLDDPATRDGVEGGMLGFVHVKDILGLSERERREPLRRRRLRPMPRLSRDLPLSDVLTQLQRTSSHLGQVVDDAGRAVGVIALEDVVEQFVGEVEDETNPLHAPALDEA